MNSRPLLDYLAYPDDNEDAAPRLSEAREAYRPADTLEARLRGLEAMLRGHEPPATSRTEDATLAARIESILGRKVAERSASRHEPPVEAVHRPVSSVRVVVDPPPTAPVAVPPAAGRSEIDREFLRFTEAVHLIGQAARRFIDQPPSAPAPEMRHAAAPFPPQAPIPAPATAEIAALSAVLQETVSAFRSLADDLAVSAGEIRNFAAREERPAPVRRPPSARFRDDEDDLLDLRESVAELQDRLDMLMRSRRRARY